VTSTLFTSVLPSYFGKIPSRPDFIESVGADHALVRHVDHWVAECIHAGGKHNGWTTAYDCGLPVDFLAVSSENRNVACGAVVPGRDSCGRRYPLIGMLRIEARLPLAFAPTAPLAFTQAWPAINDGLARIIGLPRDEPNVITPGQACEVATDEHALAALLEDYVATETVKALDESLTACHSATTTRVVTALASLLAPISGQPGARIGRGLILPLPADPVRQPRVASVWLDLLVSALGQRNVEVVALRTSGASPRLIVSFDGTRGSELLAAWMPEAVADQYIDLTKMSPNADEPEAGQLGPCTSLTQLRESFRTLLLEYSSCAN